MLIMHIGFLACFHAISLERSRFSKIATLFFLPFVALKLLVLLISRLVACSARIDADKQTNRTTTVTLAAHARRGLIIHVQLCDRKHSYSPLSHMNDIVELSELLSGGAC